MSASRDPATHQRIRAVFVEACDLRGAAREEAIERGCGGDESLRAEVRRLLARDAPEDDLLSDEAVDSGAAFAPAGDSLRRLDAGGRAGVDWLPAEIGGYRILRRIGIGGMGTVYEAEQRDPRRVVALKTMQRWSASPSLIRRFRHEAQVLGRLQHPGIAQIFEASVHDSGGGDAPMPFFVMELIRGQPVTIFVRERGLPVAERLELFIRICDAVTYAHQQGVIHRDLKPDNILVDDLAQPKILDFGIAKSIGADPAAAASASRTGTMRTSVGQIVGTLPYMSPEQVGDDPALVDGRSDVYALGVLLYQMLTDRLPHDVDGRSIPEAVRVIREENHTRLGAVDRTLRGDLETIISKAIEKDQARRYQSVPQFAEDVRRHLDHLPISARPPSTFYQLSKFARRNKALVGGALGIVMALLLGVVGTTIFALDAAASARAAVASAQAQHWSSYLARIDAAAAALDRQDAPAARRHLDLAPLEHRGWEWHHLDRNLQRWAVEIDCGAEVVGTVSFLPGDDRVMAALAGADAEVDRICAWDIRSGRQIRSIDVPEGIKAVADAAAGPLLAVATTDGAVVVIDVDAGREVDRWDACGELDIDARDLNDLAIGAEGGLLAVATRGGVAAWDRVERRVAWRFDLDAPRATSPTAVQGFSRIVASADGSVVVASQRREPNRFHIWAWDARTGAPRGPFQSGDAGRAVAVRPMSPAAPASSGPEIAAGSQVRDMMIVDAATMRLRRQLTGHAGAVRRVAYSPDGTLVASESPDRTIRIRRADGDATVAVLHDPEPLAGDAGASFSSDGASLATHGRRRIYIWNVEEGPSLVLRGHRSYVYDARFSPDGTLLASTTFGEGLIRLWDPQDGSEIARLPGLPKPTELRFASDGASIETRTARRVRICDLATGAHFDGPAMGSAEGAAEGTARLRDGDSGDDFPETAPPEGLAAASRNWILVTSPAGDMEARLRRRPGGRSATGSVVELARASGSAEAIVLPHDSIARAAAFSPDGTLLAVGCQDGQIAIWRTADGARLATLRGHVGQIYSVAFSPDRRRLASGGNDGSLRLWDTATWDQVLEQHEHTSYVHSVTFSPDGSQIATASGDGTVRLWDSSDKITRLSSRRTSDEARREMQPRVRAQVEAGGPNVAAAAIRDDPSLDDAHRRAALRELLVWSQAATGSATGTATGTEGGADGGAASRTASATPSPASDTALDASLDPTDAEVNAALQLAGPNRPEIQRFLDRYDFDGGTAPDADAQKRIAARWLVANMPGHGFARIGLVAADGREVPFDAAEHATQDAARSQLAALEKEHGSLRFKTLEFTPDLVAVTADQLERNHELAFEAWRSASWGRDIPFDAFLQHVLPHRGSHEPLDPTWRDGARARMQPVLASLRSELGRDPTLEEATVAVVRAVRTWVRFRPLYLLHPTDQSWTQMCASGAGRCEDESNMAVFAARAAGVLVACDSVSFWADRDDNHAWGVRLDPSGQGKARLAHRAAKVHRRTYEGQEAGLAAGLAAAGDDDEPAPTWLLGLDGLDVTAQYMPVSDVDVELASPPEHAHVAYLCVFNGGEWRPVHWSMALSESLPSARERARLRGARSGGDGVSAVIGRADGDAATRSLARSKPGGSSDRAMVEGRDGADDSDRTARFEAMGRNVLYLPAWFTADGVVPAGPPLLLLPDGEQRSLTPARGAPSGKSDGTSDGPPNGAPSEAPSGTFNGPSGTFTIELAARDESAPRTRRAAARATRRRVDQTNPTNQPDQPNPPNPPSQFGPSIPLIEVQSGVPHELFVWDVDTGGWRSLGQCAAEPDRPGTFAGVPVGGLYWLRNPAGPALERPFTVDGGAIVQW